MFYPFPEAGITVQYISKILSSTDVRNRQHTKVSLHSSRSPGTQLIMSAWLPLLLQDKKIFFAAGSFSISVLQQN